MTDPSEVHEPEDLNVEEAEAEAVKGGRPRYQLKLDEASGLVAPTQPTPPPQGTQSK